MHAQRMADLDLIAAVRLRRVEVVRQAGRKFPNQPQGFDLLLSKQHATCCHVAGVAELGAEMDDELVVLADGLERDTS